MSEDNESQIVFMYGCMVSLRILWCNQSGDHLENNLTKFGYMINMKVGKKWKSFYILGYLLEVIIRLWQFEKKI